MDVRLERLSCRFGATPAVHEIDLAVAEGEFLALVGPSGAGKTTLLRILAGLQEASDGRLWIGGRDMSRVPARARNIGFVFQNYALFEHMTVAANVGFGLRVQPRARRPARSVIAARVAELLELVQVTELARRYPAQLSGGQRQRVALARALATSPGLLLLDEPFGALDPLIRKDIRTWLRGLHDRLGLTSIMVTHDQEEALGIADRIAVMRGGRIEQEGTPASLEAHPASAFVHRFLGEAYGFSAHVDAGGIALDDPALADSVAALPEPGDVRGAANLSIRPHEIELRPAPDGALVEGIGEVGAYCRIALRLAGGSVIHVLVPLSAARPRIGMTCRLDMSAAKVFHGNRGAV